MSQGISRRDAIKQLGAIAGAAATLPLLGGGGGCGDDGPSGPGKISTIVVFMMENRSYDHYLGARGLLEGKPGDGLVAGMGNPDQDGVMRTIFHESVDCIQDPPHGWTPSRAELNGGANDGFVQAYQRNYGAAVDPHPMGYFARADLPVLWAMADHYTSCDRWFSSVLGPTWPNRLYLHCAQSAGAISNGFPEGGLFTLPTIYDRLNAAGVAWNYYFLDLPFLGIIRGIPSERFKRLGIEFYQDAATGKLPPVCFVDPGFGANDDHPPHHPLLGQQMIASVHAALANSPQWNEMLFVTLYDEHGGFFDHVPPPTAPDDRPEFQQLGFRVPAIVGGPWAKTGAISSVVRDHTSVLKHIENMFGLEPLTPRDAAAADLSETLDMDRMARGAAAKPATLPAVEVDESMLDASCNFGPVTKPTELEMAFDAGILPRELDARAGRRDTLYLIGDVLDRYNVGRVRRGR